MLSRDRWFLVLIVILSAFSPSVSTQSGQPAVSSTLASRPVSSASRVTEAPPSIDGALDERVWQDAAPLTGFVQAEPFEGRPASEHTEVRILYDDDAIYVGVVLHDRDPSLIVTTDSRRDAELDEIGLVPDDLRYVPRSAERIRVRHQRRRRAVRRAGARPGRGRRQLGRQLGREHHRHGHELGGRVPHSAPHAALRSGAADVGHQLLSQHPAHARARLLVVAAARTRSAAD